MPVARATELNFAFEAGAGLQVRVASGWVLVLGLKFHHISNAATADVNPGLDASVLYAGVSHFR